MCSFVVPDAKQFGIKKIQVDEQIGIIPTPRSAFAKLWPSLAHFRMQFLKFPEPEQVIEYHFLWY